jgi:hypothetical protein
MPFKQFGEEIVRPCEFFYFLTFLKGTSLGQSVSIEVSGMKIG